MILRKADNRIKRRGPTRKPDSTAVLSDDILGQSTQKKRSKTEIKIRTRIREAFI